MPRMSYYTRELKGSVYISQESTLINGQKNGIKNVRINLYEHEDAGTAGIIGDSSRMVLFREKLVNSVLTNEAGEYLFLVPNGKYVIAVDVSSLPEGMELNRPEVIATTSISNNNDFIVNAVKESKALKGNSIRTTITSKACSVDKIRMAYDDGVLDEKTKIMNLIHSVFDKNKLVQEYRSETPIKSATTAINEIYDYILNTDADPDVVRSANSHIITAIPSLDKVYLSSQSNFKIHYTNKGKNSVIKSNTYSEKTPEYIKSIGETFEHVRNVTCIERGFKLPVKSEEKEAFDVYVYDLKGIYGITFPRAYYNTNSEGVRIASSYISLDNTYSSQKGFKKNREDCMKVTVAHEYFHAVQNAYSVNADSWWKEASATWNEDEIYKGINDYLQYLEGVFSAPQRSLEKNSYGGVAFVKYLSEKIGGYELVKKIFDVHAHSSESSINVIDRAIRESKAGDSLGNAFSGFAACNYNPAQYYEDGKLWTSKVAFQNTYASYPVAKATGVLDHLSANYQLFKPGSNAKSLRLTVESGTKIKCAFKLQKKRSVDGVCEMAEVKSDRLYERIAVEFTGFGDVYDEICLVSTNMDKERNKAEYSYSAAIE